MQPNNEIEDLKRQIAALTAERDLLAKNSTLMAAIRRIMDGEKADSVIADSVSGAIIDVLKAERDRAVEALAPMTDTELEALARKVDWNYMTALAALKSVRSGSPSPPSVEPAAAANRESSLLRPPSRHAPDGCHCQPGRCCAPIIGGRQMPCRDPQKASAVGSLPSVEPADANQESGLERAYGRIAELLAALLEVRRCACQLSGFMYGAVRECASDMIAVIDAALPTPEPPKEETDANKGLPE